MARSLECLIPTLKIEFAPDCSISVGFESLSRVYFSTCGASYDYFFILSDNSLLFMPNSLSGLSINSAIVIQRSIFYTENFGRIVVDESVLNLRNFHWMSFVDTYKARYPTVTLVLVNSFIHQIDSVSDQMFEEKLLDCAKLEVLVNQKPRTWLEIVDEASMREAYYQWKGLKDHLLEYRRVLMEIAELNSAIFKPQDSHIDGFLASVGILVKNFLVGMAKFMKIAPICKNHLELADNLSQRINQTLKVRKTYYDIKYWVELKKLVGRFQPSLNNLPQELLNFIVLPNFEFEIKETGANFDTKYIMNKLEAIQKSLESSSLKEREDLGHQSQLRLRNQSPPFSNENPNFRLVSTDKPGESRQVENLNLGHDSIRDKISKLEKLLAKSARPISERSKNDVINVDGSISESGGINKNCVRVEEHVYGGDLNERRRLGSFKQSDDPLEYLGIAVYSYLSELEAKGWNCGQMRDAARRFLNEMKKCIMQRGGDEVLGEGGHRQFVNLEGEGGGYETNYPYQKSGTTAAGNAAANSKAPVFIDLVHSENAMNYASQSKCGQSIENSKNSNYDSKLKSLEERIEEMKLVNEFVYIDPKVQKLEKEIASLKRHQKQLVRQIVQQDEIIANQLFKLQEMVSIDDFKEKSLVVAKYIETCKQYEVLRRWGKKGISVPSPSSFDSPDFILTTLMKDKKSNKLVFDWKETRTIKDWEVL